VSLPRTLLLATLVLAVPAWAATGLPDVLAESGFVGLVHVESVSPGRGRFGQSAVLVVKEAWRGDLAGQVTALARDQGFSGVELLFVPGADQVVMLRRERVPGQVEEAWVLREGFVVSAKGLVMLGNGSSTWWLGTPRPYAEVRADLRVAIARDDAEKSRRGGAPPPLSAPRTPRRDIPDAPLPRVEP
jgi:hypothetical protein